MEEIVCRDVFGNNIRLTSERWNHIVEEHPEVRSYQHCLDEILKEPDSVKRSKKDRNVLLYYRYYPKMLGGKYLLAVAKITFRSFLITFYITDQIKGGEFIWRRRRG